MNNEIEVIYTTGAFCRQILSGIKESFSGKKNIIRSCIVLCVMTLLIVVNAFAYKVVGGIVCGVAVTLTFYSLIADMVKGSAFRDIRSSGAAYFSCVFGKATRTAERVWVILATTAIPLAAALLLGLWNDIGIALGLCILISSRSAESLCLRAADAVSGSLAKKNFDRSRARRYMAGFGAGLLIFSFVISTVKAVAALVNDEPKPRDDVMWEFEDFDVQAKTGTVGQLHNSIVAFNDTAEKYKVIVETVRYDEEKGLYYRTYSLWDSKDVDEYNFEQYAVYSSASAKLVVTSADFQYNTRVSGFTLYLPWYGVRGLDEGSEENRQLAAFTRAVVAGIMPELERDELDGVCTKLHVTSSDFDYMAKLSAQLSDDGNYIARFGAENMNFLAASYNSYHGRYELLFDNLALSAGVSE